MRQLDFGLLLAGVRIPHRPAGPEGFQRVARPLDLLARWGEVIRAPPFPTSPTRFRDPPRGIK